MNHKHSQTKGLAPFRVSGGNIITADDFCISIPTVVVEERFDGGANGDVFLGRDQLDRKVVVKVWKKTTSPRGFERAREEVRKLADMKEHDRLFAQVYLFGPITRPKYPRQRIAYAILEYVAGSSGNAWLKSSHHRNARYAVWKLIRTALSFVYGEGLLHGDPHLGNVIVLLDERRSHTDELTPWTWHMDPCIGIKMIDLGSSLLWADRSEFIKRECDIIGENFIKLFPEIGGFGVELPTIGSQPIVVLEAFDAWLEYSILLEKWIPMSKYDPSTYDRGHCYRGGTYSMLEQTFRDALFERLFVKTAVLREHAGRLGIDYMKVFGDEYESRLRQYSKRSA
jgi:hypothetical protein